MPLKKSAGFAFIWGDKILLSHATGAAWRFYSIIKGQAEEGESLLETALREVKEEANIILSPELLAQVKNQIPIVVQNKSKVLTAWFIRINAPEEIGMKTTYDKNDKLHTIIEKEKLQDEEIDWAGFVSFKDAEAKIAPYQLPILEAAKKLPKQSDFIKDHIIVGRPGLTAIIQDPVKITLVPTKINGIRDYDVTGHPRIHRIKMTNRPVNGDMVNVYYDDSSKTGVGWRGTVEKVIEDFDKFAEKTDFYTTQEIINSRAQMPLRGPRVIINRVPLPNIDAIDVTLAEKEKPWFTPAAELFVPVHQLDFLRELDEEGLDEYRDVFDRINRIVAEMPKTYEQDKIAYEDKTIYLHYFYSSGDWWIFEKDKGDKDDALEDRGKQFQAFGIANLNGAADDMGGGLGEMGYISIQELREIPQVELDFHFDPIKVKDLLAKRSRRGSAKPELKESSLSRAIRLVGEGVADLSKKYQTSRKGEFEWWVYDGHKNIAIYFTIRTNGSVVEFKVKGPKGNGIDRLATGQTSIADDDIREWVVNVANENLEKNFDSEQIQSQQAGSPAIYETNLSSAIRQLRKAMHEIQSQKKYYLDESRDRSYMLVGGANRNNISFSIRERGVAVDYKVYPGDGTIAEQGQFQVSQTSLANEQLYKWVLNIVANLETQQTEELPVAPVIKTIGGTGQPMNFNLAYDSIVEAIEKDKLHVANSDTFEYKLLMALLRDGFSVDVLSKDLNQPNVALLEKEGVELKLDDSPGQLRILAIGKQALADIQYKNTGITEKQLIDKVIREANIKVTNWRNK